MAVTTNTALVSTQSKPRFWITEAALSNYKERSESVPADLDTTDKLSAYIDGLVQTAIDEDKVEDVIDSDGPARLVRITKDGSNKPLFALVKKSNNPTNADYAVVTIMESSWVEKKKTTGQWGKPRFSVGDLSPSAKNRLMSVQVTAQPPDNHKGDPTTAMYLIMYSFKGDRHQIWAAEKDIEARLNELTMIDSGSLEVYRRVRLGLHVLDS